MGYRLVICGLLMLLTIPARADEKSVSYAYALCSVIDGTGLGSQPCEVSGWHSTVTAYLDMVSSEARATCTLLVAKLRHEGIRFQSGWSLQIKSPYSGDNSIAYCDLPQ